MHEPTLACTKAACYCTCGEFHTQMNHNGLISKTLDNGVGVSSSGTHQNLKKAIGRTQASGKWNLTFDEDERLLSDVTKVHVPGFAAEFWGVTLLDILPTPQNRGPPPLDEWKMLSPKAQQNWFNSSMSSIVDQFWSWNLDRFMTKMKVMKFE
jgi:hypothetical protein